MSANVPGGKSISKNEINEILSYLISDNPSYVTDVTGQEFIIDGGLTTW